MKFKPLTLGRIHLAHARRSSYCGAIPWNSHGMRTTVHEARVSCLHCLKVYDVELSNQQRKADIYKIVSGLTE